MNTHLDNFDGDPSQAVNERQHLCNRTRQKPKHSKTSVWKENQINQSVAGEKQEHDMETHSR